MLTVYSGYVKGCRKSLSRKLGFKLYNRAQLFRGRLALNPGFFFLCSTAFSLIIFCAISSNHQLVDKKNKTEMLFKLSNLNSNHTLTLGYLNPALNNLAQEFLDLPQAGNHE